MDSQALPLSRFYFDHATYTPLLQAVKASLTAQIERPFEHDCPSYALPPKDSKEVLNAFLSIRSFLGCDDSDAFIFSSSYRQTVKKVFDHHFSTVVRVTGKNHILFLPTERQEVLEGIDLMRQAGCRADPIQLKSCGRIDIDWLSQAISCKTSLLVLSWVEPTTGLIQPLEELIQLVSDQQVHVMLDISSAIGKLFFRVKDTPFTTIVIDSANIGGPQCLSLAVVKNARQSTEKIPAPDGVELSKIVALGCAFDAIDSMSDAFYFDLPLVKTAFIEQIARLIPEAEILFADREQLQSHAVILFPRIHQELMLFYLSCQQIYASIGKGSPDRLKKILTHFGVDSARAMTAVSFSFHPLTTVQAVNEAAEILAKIYREKHLIAPRGAP